MVKQNRVKQRKDYRLRTDWRPHRANKVRRDFHLHRKDSPQRMD
jgi:hypothetical protein